MGDELAGGAPGAGQAGPVDDVVQPRFEDLQQRVAGLAGPRRGLGVVATELLLHDAVGVASLLLLLQLGQVFLLLGPRAAVLAGREGATLEGLVAADQVGLEPAGDLGDGSGVAGHDSAMFFSGPASDPAPLGRPGAVVGLRGDVGDRADLEAGGLQRADGRLATRTGPLTNTSTLRMPCSIALRAAFSAAIWAAYGVDLREPLKPTWPAEAQEITAPAGSVIETMVLLNVLLMCAWPCETFFFSLRRTFLTPAAPWRVFGGIAITWPSSCRRWSSSGPCGCGRWSWCAGRGPAGAGGAGGPGRSRSPSSDGCRPAPRGAGHPRP